MNNKTLLVLFSFIIVFIMFTFFIQFKDCSDKGGILVRGLFSMECVQSLKVIE